MPESQHTIAGTVLTMRVRVRKADVHSAMFSVNADAAQRLIDYSGLRVFELRPGRAVINLLLTRFVDCDLGQYNAFSFGVMVQPPGSDVRGLRGFGTAGTFVHRVQVDGAFTLEADRRRVHQAGRSPDRQELAAIGLPNRAFACMSIAPSELTFNFEKTYECGNEEAVGNIVIRSSGYEVVAEEVFIYRVNDEGKIVALRAYWELDAATKSARKI